MRIIGSGLHRTLDFVTVVGFAVAPLALGLTGLAATLSYALALIHLTLTLLTSFPGSAARPVPFAVHGVIEGVVGVALIVLPWLAAWSGTPRTFYVPAGVLIFLFWPTPKYPVVGPTPP